MPTTVNRTYSYTGAVQTLVLPPNYIDGTLSVKVWGAGGGQIFGDTNQPGGQGDTVVCTIPGSLLSANDTVYFYVGGSTTSHNAGWNGGGIGGQASAGYNGYGGGGASDIRTGTALANRIVVAGGGGGTPSITNDLGGYAGDGGHPNGQAGFGNSFGTGSTAGSGHGGTQTAGGTAGNSVGSLADNAGAGALGVGGHGSNHSTSGAASGGAGGGGYYGGGGGGGAIPGGPIDSQEYAGNGGGGSSWTHASISGETYGYLANASIGKPRNNGQIQISYQLRDPVTAADAFIGSASMFGTGLLIQQELTSVSGRAAMAVGASRTALASPAMVAVARLSSARGASSIFASLTMSALSAMIDPGHRDLQPSLPLSSLGSLYIQQTQGNLNIHLLAALTLAGKTSITKSDPMVSIARLQSLGQATQLPGLSLVAVSAFDIPDIIGRVPSAFLTHEATLSMAAHGSVSLAGQLSALGGLPINPRVSMLLSGALRLNGGLPIVGSGSLIILPKLVHSGSAALASSAQLVIAPSLTEFVGPLMSSYGSLNVSHVLITDTTEMGALASLVIDSSEIFDPPYLTVIDGQTTMQFFIASRPVPSSVRNQMVVTNARS